MWIDGMASLPSASIKTLGKYFFHFSFFVCKIVNSLFEVLNKFKLKGCQIQSFITFRDLQLLFFLFPQPNLFTNLNLTLPCIRLRAPYLYQPTRHNFFSFKFSIIQFVPLFHISIIYNLSQLLSCQSDSTIHIWWFYVKKSISLCVSSTNSNYIN